MSIQALGYIAIGSDKLAEWSDYATHFLGMQRVERGNAAVAFRMDDRKQRLLADRALGNGAYVLGWEVADAAALDALAARLEAVGTKIERGNAALAEQRCVRGLIRFADPAGNRLEAFWGGGVDDRPFVPGRNISGFRTGALGMGHVGVMVERLDALVPFYRDTLGFGVSDYMNQPFNAFFFHVNGRHHSIAVLEAGHNGFHHMMLELFSFDDVGQGYDIAQGHEGRVSVTLGRHINDHVTSFYAKTPSGFLVEYGWGGRLVDPATWQASELTRGPELWGHDGLAPTPEANAALRAQRIENAQKGLREPVHVLAGNFQQGPGACPWWDAMKAG